MKFSIVVPVYNVEKYIRRCLESVLKQTYNEYEVIVVNDGSPDDSQSIIDEYVQKDIRFKSYTKVNGGLSDARNYGIEYATGDYLIFLDSDDYIEENLLLEISNCAKGYDVIKYNLNLVDEKGNLIKKAKPFEIEGKNTFENIINVEYFQPAWSYAYKLDFWHKNNFKFEVGKIHEDFGLVPLCVLLASNIYTLNYYGYNYVQREGSIMNGAEKMKKRAYDILFHFDNLTKQIQSAKVAEQNKKICLSFIANGTIYMAGLLEEDTQKDFINELKQRQIYKYILDDTIPRKLKKILAKYNLNGYIKYRFRKKSKQYGRKYGKN